VAQETLGLTQQGLESRLLAAANSLRGPVDPADFKQYVFPLLFFKRSATHGPANMSGR
jgi:type I restriction-modification system DNA methylase subunit